jgi:hypothetical protein
MPKCQTTSLSISFYGGYHSQHTVEEEVGGDDDDDAFYLSLQNKKNIQVPVHSKIAAPLISV